MICKALFIRRGSQHMDRIIGTFGCQAKLRDNSFILNRQINELGSSYQSEIDIRDILSYNRDYRRIFLKII